MSSSDPIPTMDTDDPPHRQASATYRKAIKDNAGRKFVVTMETPSVDNPKVLEVEIGARGVLLKQVSTVGVVAVTNSRPPRAGST